MQWGWAGLELVILELFSNLNDSVVLMEGAAMAFCIPESYWAKALPALAWSGNNEVRPAEGILRAPSNVWVKVLLGAGSQVAPRATRPGASTSTDPRTNPF